MTRRTRAQARLRLEIWDYARRYLNVKRLPPEVVRLLNEVYDRPELPLYVGLIAAQGVYVFHFWVELVHLLERSHNARFKALMDQFLPGWRDRRRDLNRSALGMDWPVN